MKMFSPSFSATTVKHNKLLSLQNYKNRKYWFSKQDKQILEDEVQYGKNPKYVF